MQTVCLTTTEQWESLAGDWGALARDNPFASWEWLTTWWKHYGAGHQLCIIAVRDEGSRLIAVAPWYVATSPTRGSVLRVLGSGEVCSEYVSLLCEPRHAAAAACRIADWLAAPQAANGERAIHWDLLSLECVTTTDTAVEKLVEQLAQCGCGVQRGPAASCWHIPLPSSWEAYLSGLSKSHRKQLQRAIRGHREGGRSRLQIAAPKEDPEPYLHTLMSLHTRRWHSLGGTGVFANRRFAAFLRDAVEALHPQGSVQLSVLQLNGEPAAADLHFISPRASFAYQGGIEPRLAHDSPGRLLTALLIQEAIAAQRTAFDFLRGDEPYKPHFRAVPVPTENIQVVSPRAASQIRNGIWLAGATVKRFVKTGLSLVGKEGS